MSDATPILPGTGPTEAAVDEALDRVMRIDDIAYAGLWLGPEEGGDAVRCVGVRPLGTDVQPELSTTTPGLRWIMETPAFNWTVSGRPLGRLDRPDRPCAFVVFALDRRVLLEVCVLESARAIASSIDQVHAALASFSRSLAGGSERPVKPSADSAVIDLEFVEAAAMGDRQFLRQILDIAAQELAVGLQGLRAAHRAGDRDALGFQAHRIRSTARTVGASALDQRMEEIETACRLRAPAAALVEDGIRAVEQVLEALRSADVAH